MHARTSNDDRGFALIPVLWALGLLAFVAVLMSRSAVLEVRLAGNMVRDTQARELADGLARLVGYNIAILPPGAQSRPLFRGDGVLARCRVGSSAATIVVLDAAGQVDLNLAPQPMLERLFRGAGLDAGEAAKLAGAVVDFRDADDTPVQNGAEAAAYQLAGLPHGPKNAPFETVGELQQVLGITPELYARLRKLVTVHSGAPGLDASVASEAVMTALAENAVVFEPGKSWESFAIAGRIPQDFFFRGGKTRATMGTARPKTYAVEVAVRTAGNGRFVRLAIMQPARSRAGEPQILEWSALRTDAASSIATEEWPDCFGLILSAG